MLAEAFGYAAEITSPTNDYGVDVIACRNGKKVVLQCKLYCKGSTGGATIRQLAGSREYHEAQEAICISTSKYTKQAHEVAAKLNIHLIDADTLIALCRKRNLTIPSLTALSNQSGSIWKTDRQAITFGRLLENNVVIDHSYVSRRHACVERNGLLLTLRDCYSANGTTLNDQLLRGASRPLNYGDQFRVGPLEFSVCLKTVSNQLIR